MIKHYIFKFYENFNLESFDRRLTEIYQDCEISGIRINVTFDLSNIGLGSVSKLLNVKPILDKYLEQGKKYLVSSNIIVPNSTTRLLLNNVVLPLIKPVGKVTII
jgi:hypothetical protein